MDRGGARVTDSGREPVIVGVAESDLGDTGLPIVQLQSQAATRALDDAGLSMRDVDGLATNGASRFSLPMMSEYFGIVPTWSDSSFAGGSSYEMFVSGAADAIRSGHCDVALITYGSNQRSANSRSLGGVSESHTPRAQFEVPYGPLAPMSMYALAAQRHMADFGTTPDQLAEVAVAAREWALRNPAAYRHDAGPLTHDDVTSSKMISSPLHVADCCLVTDGGGAVVMTTAARARDLDITPVSILGAAQATTHDSFSQMCATPGGLTTTGAAVSGPRALHRAGVELADVDVVQLYDSFTITVLLTLEALGFCEKGTSGEFVADGAIRPGGSLALNTSGGGLSYCHPGMFGIFLVIEAVRQLRGDCGPLVADGGRQIADASLALCHGTGGFLSTHATVILGVDS
jgi:acetyl-CoA acetyltransferase